MIPGAFANNSLCKIWVANRVYYGVFDYFELKKTTTEQKQAKKLQLYNKISTSLPLFESVISQNEKVVLALTHTRTVHVYHCPCSHVFEA